MKKRVSIIFVLFLVCSSYLTAQEKAPIRIACVGNSITYGVGASNTSENSYVSILTRMLGNGYEVGNFGLSGATLCRGTHKPYDQTEQFRMAQEFRPDIVTIKLGTNDSQPKVWNSENFARNMDIDLNYLCDVFESLDSKPKIYLCLPIPIVPSERWAHQADVLEGEIIPIIKKVAEKRGYQLIDLHTPLVGCDDCYPANDKLHPGDIGHRRIADAMYEALKEQIESNCRK
ncbi:hypothetical protein D0T53_09450 [Dysgonomonas sp. 216]|uniref:GDSL-type esterase/lipase family protein n=1 Tax=Dysgonomonas sp. 216 TaxID=2302934 RepID=UPI0013D7E052|nr:GDSL-type esterase/lipase family protein [Dysgonomonas sp. 216]NDW19135.1 hypothetical protein [Dysgonomonas sp. 216]